MIDMMFFNFCLRLYPSQFRNEFGDEMCAVFETRMNDVDGGWNRTFAIFSEITDMVWSALILRGDVKKVWYNALSAELKPLVQARWIIRIASLLNALFFVMVTLEPYVQTPKPENLVFLVFFSIQLVCVLFALRWERAGGIIILTATFTLGIILFWGTAYPGLEIYSFVASLLWAIPFGGFAIAYLILGYRQLHLQKQVIC